MKLYIRKNHVILLTFAASSPTYAIVKEHNWACRSIWLEATEDKMGRLLTALHTEQCKQNALVEFYDKSLEHCADDEREDIFNQQWDAQSRIKEIQNDIQLVYALMTIGETNPYYACDEDEDITPLNNVPVMEWSFQ